MKSLIINYLLSVIFLRAVDSLGNLFFTIKNLLNFKTRVVLDY